MEVRLINKVPFIIVGLIIGFWASYAQKPNLTIYLHPSSIAMALMPLFYLLKIKNRFFNSLWYLVVGLVFGGSYFIAIRQTEIIDYFQIVLIGSAMAVIYMVLLLTKSNEDEFDCKAVPTKKKEIVLFFIVVVITTCVYRFSYYSMLYIPNEDRSMMVGGIEVHHINVGVILLLVANIVELRVVAWSRYIYFIVLSFAFASITDQSFYILLDKITDEAYGGMLSTSGAIIAPVTILVLMVLNQPPSGNPSRLGSNSLREGGYVD